MHVIDAGRGLVDDRLSLVDPVQRPFGILETRQSFVERMLLPKAAPDGRIRIVDEHVLVVHLEPMRREHAFEVAGFREFRDDVTALAAEHHADPLVAERIDEPLQPGLVRRDRVRGQNRHVTPARCLDSHVERMTEREVVGAEMDDARPARGGDFPRAIE